PATLFQNTQHVCLLWFDREIALGKASGRDKSPPKCVSETGFDSLVPNNYPNLEAPTAIRN
ncbi:MAG: hypothetical protein ABI614_16290, partial [Planctomycetota bacterium]